MADSQVKFCSHRYCIWPKIMFCEDADGKVCPAFNSDSAGYTVECCGIVSGAAIRGMLLHHAGKLERPVVLLQQLPGEEDGCGLKPEARTKDDLLRQESTAFYTHNDSACTELRKNNGDRKFCFKQDQAARDWVLKNIKDKKDRDPVDDLEFLCKGMNIRRKKIKGIVRKINGVWMLVYTCLLSGYSEIAVLIECYDVRGVMIVGQTIFKDSDQRQIKRVFRKQIQTEYEKAFGAKYLELKNGWIKDSVKKRTEKQKPEGGDESFLEDVAESAIAFQNELKKRYVRQVDNRKMLVIARAEREFAQGTEELEQVEMQIVEKEPSKLAVEKHKDVVRKFAETLAERCKSENEDGNEIEEPGSQDYLGLVLEAKNIIVWSEPFSQLEELPRKPDVVETGFYKQKNGLYGYWFEDAKPDAKTIVAVSDIKDEHGVLSNDAKKKGIESIFEGVLLRFSLINAQLRAEYHQGCYKTFTRSMRHELGQLHGGNEMSLSLPKLLFNKYKKLEKKRIEYLLWDFESYLHASVMRVRSTKYMDILFPPPEYNTFFPYGEVLFKWREIYMRRARQMQIEFKLNEPKGTGDPAHPKFYADPERPKLYADRDQFEQIAYNLTNNAFKYALDGTVVEVDCRLDPEDNEWYCFRITNYSFDLLPGEAEQLGNYGFRAKNAEYGVDGSGLGLWSCKKLTEGHKGELSIVSENISEYSFRSLLLYRRFNEKEREFMFKKAKQVYDIALEEYKKVSEDNKQPKLLPFSTAEEMGQVLEEELKKLRSRAIWTSKAENFDTKKESVTVLQDLLSPYTAGNDLMKGTMLFTITVRLPKKPHIEGSRA